MKNNSNIYDIDGELIRSFDDTHRFTLEEAQNQMEKYRKKLQEMDEKDPKAVVYATYMRNLSNYIMTLYATMKPEELQARLKAQDKLNEQVNEAIEQLKADIENDRTTEERTEDEIQGGTTGDSEYNTNGESGDDKTIERTISDVHEEGPTTQGDLLVERVDVNNNMDEYTEFEEVSE